MKMAPVKSDVGMSKSSVVVGKEYEAEFPHGTKFQHEMKTIQVGDETFKSNLKPKSGPKQFGYNYYLEEYNKFLNEVDFSKIFDECKSYGISGSGLNGLMAITDCRYRELKYITKNIN